MPMMMWNVNINFIFLSEMMQLKMLLTTLTEVDLPIAV